MTTPYSPSTTEEPIRALRQGNLDVRRRAAEQAGSQRLRDAVPALVFFMRRTQARGVSSLRWPVRWEISVICERCSTLGKPASHMDVSSPPLITIMEGSWSLMKRMFCWVRR